MLIPKYQGVQSSVNVERSTLWRTLRSLANRQSAPIGV